MTPERWRKIEEVFQTLIEHPVEERSGLLRQYCGDDAELRREIEALLEQDEADEFLKAPIQDAARSLPLPPEDNLSGQNIGSYRLLREIGHGGMGKVYLARDDRLDRRVALKLLPAHLTDDADRVARFQREARAASALNHPNILTIYDFG